MGHGADIAPMSIGSRLEHSFDPDGKAHHVQPPEKSQVRPKQEHSGHRRQRQRQDQVLRQALMQMHSSYVVTDPKGQLLSEVGTMLRRGAPSWTRTENPAPRSSMSLKSSTPSTSKERNTTSSPIFGRRKTSSNWSMSSLPTPKFTEKNSEDFWVKAERLLYCALIGYIWYEAEPEEKNFLTLLELINASEAREDGFGISVARGYSQAGEGAPGPLEAVPQIQIGCRQDLKSILIICGARLAPFDIAELREIMSDGTGHPGRPKTALFLIMSDTDTTFIRYRHAAKPAIQSPLRQGGRRSGRLPVHVRCLLDEFANIGQIPNFDK